MDKEVDNKPKLLIDEKVGDMDFNPEARDLLLKMAIEENQRIKSIEMEGRKWHCCADCQHFEGLRNDKKGIKTLLKRKIWGYCLNTDTLKKPKKKYRHHIIYVHSHEPKLVIPSKCFKPIPNNPHSFLNQMLKLEGDDISELLKDPSLSKEERMYFTELKKTFKLTQK
jgi:hypothetical protein